MFARQQKMMIYVTNQTLIASLWHGKTYQSHHTYQNQEVGHTAFRQYLLQHQQATIYVMVDVVEEAYQLEVLPHVATSARREMLARKLNQFSRNSDYKTACFVRRGTTARKEDIFVLLALTNSHFLQHWIATLQSAQALLVGVYALPVVTQAMVRQMKIASPQLLVCERLSAGLRQTYLQHGRLCVSRLTPIDNKQSSQIVDFYVAEVEKMRLYLLSQRIINAETVLQVMLSSVEAERHDVVKKLEQQGFRCVIANRQDEIKKSHLKQTDVRINPELHYMQFLSMQLLGGVDMSANLAPAEVTQNYRIKQLTNKIYIIAAVVFMIGLFVTVSFFLQGIKENEQINRLTKQTDSLRKQQALVVSRYPESPISGADAKAVVTTAKMVSQPSPLPLMQIISTVLNEIPEASINRIRWVQSEQESVVDEESGIASKVTNVDAHNNEQLLQIGFVSANISHFTGDYQQALASASRFVSNLRADNRVKTVQIIQMPVDAKVSAITQGNTNNQQVTQPEAVAFKLKVILSETEKEGL